MGFLTATRLRAHTVCPCCRYRLLRVFNHLVALTRAKVVLISDGSYDSAGLFSAQEHGIKFEAPWVFAMQ
jgi:hypothetical protein